LPLKALFSLPYQHWAKVLDLRGQTEIQTSSSQREAMLASFVTQDLTKIVEFMRKDQDHVIFKRFERLHLYNLLSLQHRMTELDTKITTYEKEHDAEALAEALSELEPLINSYSENR
jgi:hypothetical protein